MKIAIEDYVHSVLAANYYNFLILYAKYLPDLRKHEMKGPERFLKSLQEGDYTELVQIVTFKNIIKYFTKVMVMCIDDIYDCYLGGRVYRRLSECAATE